MTSNSNDTTCIYQDIPNQGRPLADGTYWNGSGVCGVGYQVYTYKDSKGNNSPFETVPGQKRNLVKCTIIEVKWYAGGLCARWKCE